MGTTGAVRKAGPGSSVTQFAPVSVKGDWQAVHLDAEATAQTSAELIRPGSVSSSNVIPIEIGDRVTRVLIRAKYSAAGAVTTSPVVRVIGAYGKGLIPDSTIPDDGTVRFVILASAQTITLTAATDVRDTSWSYSPVLSPTSGQLGIDLAGANYLLVFVETAGNVVGSISLEALFIN
jgi:hypothetical protein